MILAATLLWAVEVILVKRLVDRRRAADACGGADGTRRGAAGRRGSLSTGRVADLLSLGCRPVGLGVLTGLLLTAYVATWYAALARAQAVDVTAVLVFGAVVTALLAAGGGRCRRSTPSGSRSSPPARRSSRPLRCGRRARGCARRDRRAAPLRALRVSAERARSLRRRRAAHAARVRRRGRVGRRARRARAHVRGRVALPDADRGRERHRRPARPARRGGLLGRQRPARPRRGRRPRASRRGPLPRTHRPRWRADRRRRGGRRRAAPLLPCLRRLPVARAAADGHGRRAAARPRPLPRSRPPSFARSTGTSVEVLLRPLVWDGRPLALGPAKTRTARWREDGLALRRPPEPGDWVSLHWDFVCDRLSPRAAAVLDRATSRALAAVNSSASTAHALG